MTRGKKNAAVVTANELRARKKGERPVTQLATRELHKGKFITLDRDTVHFPDDSEAELEIIRHPGASAVIPFLSGPLGDEPQLLLLRQFRYAAGGYLYEIPAGRLEAGESPMECAIRELQEETGCRADHIEPLTTILTTPGFTDEAIHLFMATGLIHGEPNREADEFVELVIMRLSEALEGVSKGEITDAKTIVALLFAAGFKTG